MINIDIKGRRVAQFVRLAIASLGLCSVSGMATAQQSYSPLPHSVRHAPAVLEGATDVPADEDVVVTISLAPRDMPGLKAYAEAANDPHSPYYHKFLTPEEIASRYGPSQTDVNASVVFLRSHGIRVNDVAKNNFVVFAEGRADTVAKTFKTRLGYIKREDGTRFRTNLTELQIPSTLVSKVVSVDGIDSSIRKEFRAHKFKKAQNPLSTDPTTTTITPALYRSAFGNTGYAKGFYGQGVNIAIANWDGYQLSNIPYWTSANNLPVPQAGAGTNITVVKVGNGNNTYGQGNAEGEGDLDLQAVLMAAPLANILDYDDSTDDSAAPLTTYSQISSDNRADIVTESYGWETSFTDNTGANTTYYGSFYVSCDNVHVSLAAQGITYLAASGDTGTRTFVAPGTVNGECVAYPDIDPNVLIVGGTVPTIDETTGALVNETNWGLLKSGSRYGGGTGGFDPYDSVANGFTFNVAPNYQTANISSVTNTYNFRLVPDIANVGAGANGLTVAAIYINYGGTGSTTGLDGTSLASPATAGSLAGIMSQVYAGVTPNTNRSNVRFGDLHSFLYTNGSDSDLMYDITTGIGIGDLPQTSIDPTPDTGWDFATGWGSPIFSGFLNYTTTGSSLTSLSPTTALSGSSTLTLTVNGTGFNSHETVVFNGTALTTMFESATQLQATVPSSLLVSGGTFNVTVSAPLGPLTGAKTFTVTTVAPPPVTAVKVAPSPVIGGVSTKVAVYLNQVAPTGGVQISVASNSAAAVVPTTITIPSGSSAANSTVTTSPVANSTTVTITAKSGNSTVQTTMVVLPPSVSSVKVAPSPVLGGVSTKVAVYLNAVAPTGGFPVTVTSNNAAAALSGTITVPAGATAANETVTTTPVASSTTVTITAKTGTASVQTTFTVVPPSVTSVKVAPAPVLGGVSTKVAVYLNGVAPTGGFPVTVSSNNAAAALSGTVTVPAGATAANETVTTTPVASSTTVTITAKTGTTSVQTTFTVVPPSVSLVRVAPSPIVGGVSTKVAVYLTGAAPTGGFVVNLMSSNGVVQVPTTIKVPAGATAANAVVTTSAVTSSTTVTITATTGSTSVTTTMVVNP